MKKYKEHKDISKFSFSPKGISSPLIHREIFSNMLDLCTSLTRRLFLQSSNTTKKHITFLIFKHKQLWWTLNHPNSKDFSNK